MSIQILATPLPTFTTGRLLPTNTRYFFDDQKMKNTQNSDNNKYLIISIKFDNFEIKN